MHASRRGSALNQLAREVVGRHTTGRAEQGEHMRFTVDDLLAWARQHEGDAWTTLRQDKPFRYQATQSGIICIPASGTARIVPRNELTSLGEAFEESRSYSPGGYPHRWHKSYTLPLITRFLRDRSEA